MELMVGVHASAANAGDNFAIGNFSNNLSVYFDVVFSWLL